VPDRVLVEPDEHDSEGLNRGVNKAHDLTGLVTLLTAAEARISRLEKQVEDERDRVNEAWSEADRLRTEVAHLTARADRAEQTSTLASAACKEATEIAGELRRDLDAARVIAGAAQHDAQEAAQAAAALRQADAEWKARGRLRRAWDGWRGR
jgi:regulator of replication initiation timing